MAGHFSDSAPKRGVRILYMGLPLRKFKSSKRLISKDKTRETALVHANDKNEPGMKDPLDLRSDANG